MELSFPEPYTAMTRERIEPREAKTDVGTEDKRREPENGRICIENQQSNLKKLIKMDGQMWWSRGMGIKLKQVVEGRDPKKKHQRNP